MALFSRLIILTACALLAYSLPTEFDVNRDQGQHQRQDQGQHQGQDQGQHQGQDQEQGQGQGQNQGQGQDQGQDQGQEQDKCNAVFEKQQETINSQISIQTMQCIATTQSVNNFTLINLAPEVNEARKNLTALEFNLNQCTSIDEDSDFVSCVLENQYENQKLLDHGYSLTSDVEHKANAAFERALSIQETCVNNVLMCATNNFTLSFQEYQNCMAGDLSQEIM